MEEREQLQREVLKELITYSDNLIPALQILIEELRTEGQEDTNTFLNDVINGINWEIEVFNQCMSLINEKGSYIDKKSMINAVKNLGNSLSGGDILMGKSKDSSSRCAPSATRGQHNLSSRISPVLSISAKFFMRPASFPK